MFCRGRIVGNSKGVVVGEVLFNGISNQLIIIINVLDFEPSAIGHIVYGNSTDALLI
jgi:hypothetical protein